MCAYVFVYLLSNNNLLRSITNNGLMWNKYYEVIRIGPSRARANESILDERER